MHSFFHITLFILVFVSINRYAGFKYFCKCSGGCFEKDQFSCDEYGKNGKNGCKYCRFMKCRESAGMVDKWVKSAYSQESEATGNDEENLIQGSTSDKSSSDKKTGNTSVSNLHDHSDSQQKRLKHCQSVLGNDKVIINVVIEKSDYFKKFKDR